VDCKLFLNIFIKIGIKLRSEKHLLIIEKQKNHEKNIKREVDLRNDLFRGGKNFQLDVSTDEIMNGTCHLFRWRIMLILFLYMYECIIFVYMYIYVYVYINIYVYIYIYI
jgi:hypothetical protein